MSTLCGCSDDKKQCVSVTKQHGHPVGTQRGWQPSVTVGALLPSFVFGWRCLKLQRNVKFNHSRCDHHFG